MPTSVPTRYTGILSPPQQLAYPPTYRPNSVMLSSVSHEAPGADFAGVSSSSFGGASVWPAASRVVAFPFCLGESFLVQKVWWVNGSTTIAGSADVGVYTEDGATLLVSGGSTVLATANVLQEKDCTDTVLIGGQRYWCAMVASDGTYTPVASTASSVAVQRAMGWAQMAGSGSTLGSTFTPAAIATGFLPLFGIAARTQVA